MGKLKDKTTAPLKGWVVFHPLEEWVMIVHGETKGKAKSNFLDWNPSMEEYDFTELIAYRMPKYDGVAIERDEPVDCLCELCKVKRKYPVFIDEK